MTHKTDGKSSSSTSTSSSSDSSSSSEFFYTSNYKTQGPEKEEYVAHDISARTDYKPPNTSRRWLAFGGFLGVALILYAIQKKEYDTEMAIIHERVQKQQAEQQRMQQQQQQNQPRDSETFQDA